MPSPALRSRTVPSPNRQVTDSSPERLHTTNTVQALMERDRSWRQRREDSSGRKLARQPADALRSDLELGGLKSQSFCCFWFKFTPFPVLVVVALDGMALSKCTFMFPPPPEAHCLERAKQEGLEVIPQAKV